MFKISREMWRGIILTFGVAIIAKALAPFLPALGGETLAMFIGLLLGNTIFSNDRWSSGVKWSEKYPIEVGIALLGVTLTLGTIASLKLQGLLFIIAIMILTITFVMWIGQKLFKVDQQSSMLMAVGNAVCGSSAIASVAPAIHADNDKRRYGSRHRIFVRDGFTACLTFNFTKPDASQRYVDGGVNWWNGSISGASGWNSGVDQPGCRDVCDLV